MIQMTQLTTSHDLTTLVLTELTALVKIDLQKIDTFGELPVLQENLAETSFIIIITTEFPIPR
jgi:hypothetical protein